MKKSNIFPAASVFVAIVPVFFHCALADPPTDPTPGFLVELSAALNPVGSDLAVPKQWENVRGSLAGYYFSEPAFDQPERFISTGTPPITYYSTSGLNNPPNSGSFGTWPVGLANATGETGNEPDIRLGENFSLEVWLRLRGPRGGAGGDHQLLAIQIDPVAHPQAFLLDLSSQFGTDASNTAIDLWFRDDSGGVEDTHDDVLELPIRTDSDPFDHLVVTYNGATDEVVLHLNNVASATVSVNKTGGYTFDSSLSMNHTSFFKTSPVEGDGRAFNGDIATFRFYDVILTPSQIADNFAFGPEVVAPESDFGFDLVTMDNVKAFRFTSEAGLDYELQKSATTLPGDFQSTGAFARGDGGVQFMHDPAGYDPSAAYRVVETEL